MSNRSLTERFLTSIGITDDGTFDDFTVNNAARNSRNKVLIEIDIHKVYPWHYPTLISFQRGLKQINYPYKLTFKYDNLPSLEDVRGLFFDWHQSIFFLPADQQIECHEPDSLVFVFKSDKEYLTAKHLLLDFQEFLHFIGYPVIIDHDIRDKVEVEDEAISDDDDDDQMEFSSFDTEFTDEIKLAQDGDGLIEDVPPPTDDDQPVEVVEEVSKPKAHVSEQQLEFEDQMVKVLRANDEAMKRDRLKISSRKKGDYQPIKISEIDTNSGNVDFDALIFTLRSNTTKRGQFMVLFSVGDQEGKAIAIKAFESGKVLPRDKLLTMKVGQRWRIRGGVDLDVDGSVVINAHFLDELPPLPLREDTAEVKRVELHLHTKMSQMDGVGAVENYCRLAKNMGHKALAITDHGVVQAFPEAQKYGKEFGLKMLYGIEFYMIDTELHAIANPAPIELRKAKYVVFDLETTGLSAKYDRVIEFGAVKVEGGSVISHLDILINPGADHPVTPKITQLTNITSRMLSNESTFDQVVAKIRNYIGDAILISHNAQFDIGFLNAEFARLGLDPIKNPIIDTLPLSRYLFPEASGHRLGLLATRLEVDYDPISAHRADYDAEVLHHIWQAMIVKLTLQKPRLLHSELAELTTGEAHYKHLWPYHTIAFAKNEQGLKDLYRLVSLSHTTYSAEVPKIPRHILSQYRANLLLGSSCFNGEVFDTARTKVDDQLDKAVNYYDYIEIQPPANYSHLINMDEFSSKKELYRYLNDIIQAAKRNGKLVVATGDVHYVNPSDKIFRDVFIHAKGIGGVPHPLYPYAREKKPRFANPDQHYRSTTEMIEAFTEDGFLNQEDAFEYVVTNSNKINDAIEAIKPIKDALFTPKIDNVDILLKDLCYKTAREWYGEVLPEIVARRLSAELDGIINHGYAIIYYIASKIVKKANEDGYMVGSRGSVGSSFVATMAGITEVNPLPPHYRCPKCGHYDFDAKEIKNVNSGYELPEKKCPKCRSVMVGDGQDIPFATFLGFNADKVPDIDLNFPGDYQAQAHEYTKELLGSANVFKAGTIETVADKTAFGYVRGYYERIGRNPDQVSRTEIAYLAANCVDVKRTTGQHPGGIVVIPSDMEVYDFTPIQYPADNKESEWLTTHFDFKAIHDNVLKLDLLGHVDPMALKMMGDLTNIDPLTIPMSDKNVLSLFSSSATLKMKRNYFNTNNGALALPEFGTDFVRGILDTAQPQTFSDLVIISGLSHGTDVWRGNAEDLIRKGITDIRGVIGCRDDIMTYLIKMGIEPKTAFTIMESVRRGRRVSAEQEKLMKSKKVPQYYIDSCNKIKYMFPKAHATAYVMMGVRVGWFKVYKPLAFYATYFTVRSDKFDLAMMIGSEKQLEKVVMEYRARRMSKTNPLKATEEEVYKTLQIALEMVDRGYKCLNIDLYRSQASSFSIDEEKQAVIPSFTTIPGLGEAAAQSVIEARKDGPFLSVEDLISRTKLNSQNIDRLRDLGVFKDLPETNQINLFDFA